MTYRRDQNTFDSGPQGGSILASNSGGSGTAFSRKFGAGIATYDAASAIQGAFGMLTEATASIIAWELDLANAPLAAGISFEFMLPSLPGADFSLTRFLNSAGTRMMGVHVNGTNRLRVSDNTGTEPGLFTAAAALTAGTKYRLELYGKTGAGTNDGQILFAYFLAGSNVPIETFSTSTASIGGTGAVFTKLIFGRYTSSAIQAVFDSVVWETDGTGLPGPLSVPLATPALTVTSKTDPTTAAGTDGKAVVTWPGVSDAVSYEAWRAPGTTPAAADFVRIAQGVTSPYTFTGLGASAYTVAIRAKAS
jgi:hypothetical protein